VRDACGAAQRPRLRAPQSRRAALGQLGVVCACDALTLGLEPDVCTHVCLVRVLLWFVALSEAMPSRRRSRTTLGRLRAVQAFSKTHAACQALAAWCC
jgi:hypothetical protein